jgi:hypothetical protein
LRRTDDLLRHRVSRNANEEDARHLTVCSSEPCVGDDSGIAGADHHDVTESRSAEGPAAR